VGFTVGFGLLAALILVFPLVTPAGAGFGVVAIPRAAGGLAAADAGMGFFIGAGLPPVTGFLV
jgi:hypothetical protein